MSDNTNKVTIDADYFAELWKIANEADKVCEDCVREKCGECKVVKERDELRAKLGRQCPGEMCKHVLHYKQQTYKADEIVRKIDEELKTPNELHKHCEAICDIIRAYREAKEEVK